MQRVMHCITTLAILDEDSSPHNPYNEIQNAWQPGCLEGLTFLLSTLGPACPALQKLHVDGNVARELLAAFGVHCNKLSCLEVVNVAKSETFHQLHLILPGLTHFKLGTIGDLLDPIELDLSTALLTCKTLIGLDVSWCELRLDSVFELPPGLTELKCSLGYKPPIPSFLHMGALKKLTMYLDSLYNNIKLSTLAGLLNAAPRLQHIVLLARKEASPDEYGPSIRLTCLPASIANLRTFHACIDAGLEFAFEAVWSHEVISWNLELKDLQPGFLESLPPLPYFASIILKGGPSKPSSVNILRGIHTAFPTVSNLALTDLHKFRDSQLSDLAACTALKSLTLCGLDITPLGLTMVCSRLPSMKSLAMYACSRCQVGVNRMKVILQAWDLDIKVHEGD